MQMTTDTTKTTPRPLSAKAKRMVLKATSSHRINLQMARHATTDEDKISELDMDITFASAVIRMIEEWGVKVP